MRQNKITKAMALMLSLTMITSVFVGNTLSRYVTSVSSTDSARVAVWGINGDEVSMELFNTSYDLDGKKIAESNNKTDKIIAPGTGGQSAFSIINFEDSTIPPEVAYQVKISLDDSQVDPKIVNNTSIQWKLDNNAWGTFDQLKTSLLSLSGHESGSFNYMPGTFADAFKGNVEHKIYWKWAMDGNNEIDTQMGNDALISDIGVSISVKITAQQTDDLVTNENLLDGANQIVNINDVQPLTLRSASDIENFQSVKVGDVTLTEGTHYTKTSGSTVITLHKEYLSGLAAGTYTIYIISTDMTASTRFSVKEAPIVHNGIIPEGGTYYVGVGEANDYISAASKVIMSGNKFPEQQTGDVYVYGDYEYRYNIEYGSNDYWIEDKSLNGWSVRYIGEDEIPSSILTTINNKNILTVSDAFHGTDIVKAPVIPETVKYMSGTFMECNKLIYAPEIPKNVTDMSYTFENCTLLVNAPIIPNSVLYMDSAFSGCASLVNAPVIPSSIINMESAFYGCTSLTGTIEINANPTNCEWVFENTIKPITLIGNSDKLAEIAATATNGNVTVQEEMIPCNCDEYGCDMCPVN